MIKLMIAKGMIVQFLKNMLKSYFTQILYLFIFSFFAFTYIGDYGFVKLDKAFHAFLQIGPQFFWQLLTKSAYDYLYVIPFIVPPFLLIWVFAKRYFFKYKIQQINKHTNAHILHDAIEGIFASISFTLVSMVVVKMANNGYGKLYSNLNDFPVYNIPLSIAACLLVEDAWFYWVHRAMHHKSIYKYIHASHHISIDTTPFSQNAFHFVEAMILPIGGMLPTFFIPTYGPAFTIFLLFGGISNLVAHLGYEFYPSWMLSWKTTSTHHNMHHQYFDGNYGTHFTFWDKVCKTEFKDYEDRFKEVKTRVSIKN
jgi:sterol desaturase/sphingolipid hydroxylase (fatty acid hydroxylase superfamily)